VGLSGARCEVRGEALSGEVYQCNQWIDLANVLNRLAGYFQWVWFIFSGRRVGRELCHA
jgi:hypothetical protein